MSTFGSSRTPRLHFFSLSRLPHARFSTFNLFLAIKRLKIVVPGEICLTRRPIYVSPREACLPTKKRKTFSDLNASLPNIFLDIIQSHSISLLGSGGETIEFPVPETRTRKINRIESASERQKQLLDRQQFAYLQLFLVMLV
jgi:hypothetical protein